MSKTNTKANINANIKTNGNQAITGAILNSALIAMVDDYAEQEKLTNLESEVDTINDLFVFGNINLFNTETAEEYIQGKFCGNTGSEASNANWSYITISVESGKKYSIYGGRTITCYYSDSIAMSNVVSGGSDSSNNRVIEIPSNVKYVRISALNANWDNMIVCKSETIVSEIVQTKPSAQLDVYNKAEVDAKIVRTTIYTIGTDYANLRLALDAIKAKRPNFYNRYLVRIPKGNYDIKSLFTSAELSTTNYGLFVPPYTKLLGLGNREEVKLYWENESVNNYNAPINTDLTSELENLFIYAVKCRYALHDDWTLNKWDGSDTSDYWSESFLNLGYERKIKNCIIQSVDGAVRPAYGAGTMSAVNWVFEGCKFLSNKAYTISIHNNTGFLVGSKVKFVSCVIDSPDTYFGRLISLNNNANGIQNYVTFYGCKVPTSTLKLILLEESPTSTWGTGCLWNVNGFGNTFDNTKMRISVSDGVDYSSHLELI